MSSPRQDTQSRRGKTGFYRRILDELEYGGHISGLHTSALAFTTALLLGYTPALGLLLTAYLFTYASYTLNRKKEWQQDLTSLPERTQYVLRRARYSNIIITVSYVIAFAIAFLTNLIFFAALLVPLILSYLYNVGSKRFVPIIGVSRLKEKLLVKNIVVSAGWGLAALLTLLYYLGPFSATVLIIFAFITLRLFVNTVFCDIRDVKGDAETGIKTLPIVLGVRRTRFLLIIINTLSGLFVLLAIFAGLLPPMAHIVNLVTLYAYYYILKSFSPKANMAYLTDFVADGEGLVMIPLAILGKMML